MVRTKADLIQVGHRLVRIVTLGPQTGLRELRGALLEVMLWLDQQTDSHAAVTISTGRLLEKRIVSEIVAVRRITAPEIVQRLHACVLPERPDDPCAGFEPWLRTPELAEAIRRNRRTQHGSVRPAFPQVLMVLVQDLLGGVPVRTRHELERITDLSYPSIARALAEFGSLLDDGYRALRLRDFPRDAWERMLANRSAWRQSQTYCVATGLPFKPERLMRRIHELDRQDLAFGGVVGARAYGQLDLVGIPRLDVSMHTPIGMMDLTWVGEVAPELRPCTSAEAPHFVVHAVRRAEALFTRSAVDSIADRAEVLLDLYELRLVEQANTFIHDSLAESTHG